MRTIATADTQRKSRYGVETAAEDATKSAQYEAPLSLHIAHEKGMMFIYCSLYRYSSLL